MNFYRTPSVGLLQDTVILACSQYGAPLTGLTGCGIISDCPPQSSPQTATYHLNLCTIGITDPADLNGSSYVVQKSGSGCTDDIFSLSNCALTDDISCNAGSLAVSCEYVDSCSLVIEDCSYDAAGVSTDGNFFACPVSG